MKQKLIFFLSLILVIGCNQSTETKQIEKETKYEKWLNKNISAIDSNVKRIRDSVYTEYQHNPIYKRLYIDSSVVDTYVVIVEQLGYLLLTRMEHRFMLYDDRMKYIEQIPGGTDFLLTAGFLAFRGEYIPEFESLIHRYYKKYGYYGTINNTIQKRDKSELTTFKYNLFYGELYVDAANQKALEAMAQASSLSWFKWEKTNPTTEMGAYMHPQFVFQEEFYSYLKSLYPNSSFLPEYDYLLTPQKLHEAYKQNEVAADRKYKGKKIQLTGIITRIAKNAFDRPYITISTDDYFSDINCWVKEDEVMGLVRNQQATLIGTCDGLFMGSVFLKDCSLQ